MDYNLAKQLEQAGFPRAITWDDGQEVYPTLEELIEACGEGFYELCRITDDEWYSRTFSFEERKAMRIDSKLYSTPAEAVARLWLALNKKEV